MKHYTLSFAQALDYAHPAPERTASRGFTGINFDRYYQVWPNRASMLKTIELQERRPERRASDWTAVLPKGMLESESAWRIGNPTLQARYDAAIARATVQP